MGGKSQHLALPSPFRLLSHGPLARKSNHNKPERVGRATTALRALEWHGYRAGDRGEGGGGLSTTQAE